MKKDVRSRNWKDLLAELESGTLAPEDVGPAIVKVGKTDDPSRIHSLKKIILRYFHHPDSWARHEAMWFVRWGNFHDFSRLIVERMHNDPREDNRCYAAICLGNMYEGTRETGILKVLVGAVRNPDEKNEVRSTAYGAILHLWYGKEGRLPAMKYECGDPNLDLIDWDWLNREIPVERNGWIETDEC